MVEEGGIYTHLFYSEARYEVNAGQEDNNNCLDPFKRFMDRPKASPINFNREVDLGSCPGQMSLVKPVPLKGHQPR